jgi:hypothetical protein
LNDRVLVATHDGSNDGRPALFRCNHVGEECIQLDISAGAGMHTASMPSLAIDPVSRKLVVAAMDDYDPKNEALALYRCDLDGTSCERIAPWPRVEPPRSPAIAVDAAGARLLIATTNHRQVTLVRCDLRGRSCVAADRRAGVEGGVYFPSLAVDPTTHRVFVVTTSDPGVALFSSP